jgi:ectoine hydroxylase-related dioxygenase (phytanoyl-CoA dioxygenase family)
METSTIERTSAAAEQLLDQGYCIIRNLVPQETVAFLAGDLEASFALTPHSTGLFYGSGTRRFHGLLRRSRHAGGFVMEPAILGLVEAILGPHCDTVQLNLTQGIEIEPGSEAQPPHRDQDMWPIHAPGVEYLVNVMWPFTPYTAENGATRIWPGSHRRQDEMLIAEEEAVAAEMGPGDALVFLGSTLHGGGANRAQHARRGMIVSYSLGWLKPYELPWLAYPPEVARRFSKPLADLAGYRAHRPNLGTHEGRCPSMLLEDRGPSRGAIDALREDQEQLILAWRGARLAAQ